jgi:hypothetical protein
LNLAHSSLRRKKMRPHLLVWNWSFAALNRFFLFFLEVQSLFCEVGDFAFVDSGPSGIFLQSSVEIVAKSCFSGYRSFVSIVFQMPVRLYLIHESCFHYSAFHYCQFLSLFNIWHSHALLIDGSHLQFLLFPGAEASKWKSLRFFAHDYITAEFLHMF